METLYSSSPILPPCPSQQHIAFSAGSNAARKITTGVSGQEQSQAATSPMEFYRVAYWTSDTNGRSNGGSSLPRAIAEDAG
ncbi:hypothetical protein ACJZ2D_011261 [Fusarium nematophilum]